MKWSTMFSGLTDALSKLGALEGLVERRGHYRLSCRRSVNMMLQSKVVGGHMINLSAKGMKVRSPERLRTGSEMRLIVVGNKTGASRFVASIDLICRVIWSKHAPVHEAHDSGLEYVPAPGVDMQYVDAFFRHEMGIDDLATFQRRTSRRVSTELDVTCFTPDGRVSMGAVRDVSLRGAQFEGALDLETGSEIRLRIDIDGRKDGLYCVGTVVRCQPMRRDGWFEIGVSFTEIGSPSDLKKIIARALRERSGG